MVKDIIFVFLKSSFSSFFGVFTMILVAIIFVNIFQWNARWLCPGTHSDIPRKFVHLWKNIFGETHLKPTSNICIIFIFKGLWRLLKSIEINWCIHIWSFFFNWCVHIWKSITISSGINITGDGKVWIINNWRPTIIRVFIVCLTLKCVWEIE